LDPTRYQESPSQVSQIYIIFPLHFQGAGAPVVAIDVALITAWRSVSSQQVGLSENEMTELQIRVCTCDDYELIGEFSTER
jgi:hypothetical protein